MEFTQKKVIRSDLLGVAASVLCAIHCRCGWMFRQFCQKIELKMSRNLKIFVAAIFLVGVFTQDKICDYLGFGQVNSYEASTAAEHGKVLSALDSAFESDYFISETVYRWDEQLMDWAIAKEMQEFRAQLADYSSANYPLSTPIEIDWKVLMDIRYKLRYFAEFDMEIYAPVFSKAVEALHEKEVIIEGFVIPFDEEGEFLSLSFNPYASCFFCGKASPASVISMYLKDKSKRYKMDDFKKFRGTLYLNPDDPNDFYYILRDAKEE